MYNLGHRLPPFRFGFWGQVTEPSVSFNLTKDIFLEITKAPSSRITALKETMLCVSSELPSVKASFQDHKGDHLFGAVEEKTVVGLPGPR